MILGSGNVVHNLRQVEFEKLGYPGEGADWAVRFDADVQKWIKSKDFKSLSNYAAHPDAKKSVPTPDHFLPLVVVAGASEPDDEVKVITEGCDGFSLTMTSFAFSKPSHRKTDL